VYFFHVLLLAFPLHRRHLQFSAFYTARGKAVSLPVLLSVVCGVRIFEDFSIILRVRLCYERWHCPLREVEKSAKLGNKIKTKREFEEHKKWINTVFWNKVTEKIDFKH